MKLNLGCGKDIRDGWVNIDYRKGPGVNLAIDLDDDMIRLPYADGTVTEIYAAHILEHLFTPLPLMAELHRVAVPGCMMTVRTPHGASDDAWEDPTHVRPIFPGSFFYFGQPVYWRADYGYKGDWDIQRIDLHVNALAAEFSLDELQAAAVFSRNVIKEIVATLAAVKPARSQDRALLKPPPIHFVRPA